MKISRSTPNKNAEVSRTRTEGSSSGPSSTKNLNNSRSKIGPNRPRHGVGKLWYGNFRQTQTQIVGPAIKSPISNVSFAPKPFTASSLPSKIPLENRTPSVVQNQTVAQAKDSILSSVWQQLVGAGRELLAAGGSALRGIGMNLFESGRNFLKGIGQIFSFAPWRSLGTLLKAGIQGAVQTPFDATVVAGGKALLGLNTLVGLNDPGKPLTAQQRKEIGQVFGANLDLDSVRITQLPRWFSIFNADRPFVLGNTIMLPAETSLSSRDLIHEMGHVRQYQDEGTDYISESLFSQLISGVDAYSSHQTIRNGASWSELNPEQQAEIVAKAYEADYFRDNDRTNSRLLIGPELPLPTEPNSSATAKEERVTVVSPNSPLYDSSLASGFIDISQLIPW